MPFFNFWGTSKASKRQDFQIMISSGLQSAQTSISAAHLPKAKLFFLPVYCFINVKRESDSLCLRCFWCLFFMQSVAQAVAAFTASSNTHANAHTHTHMQCLFPLFVFPFPNFKCRFLSWMKYWSWNNQQWTNDCTFPKPERKLLLLFHIFVLF